MQDAYQIRLEIPSVAEYIGLVRHTVQGIASRMDFSPTDIGDLALAVGEACTNAVKHGCPSSANPCITITCSVTRDGLEIEISNGLPGGKACPVIVDELDRGIEGGRGLFIIQKVMDEVQIYWEDHTATIRMVKRKKSAASQAKS